MHFRVGDGYMLDKQNTICANRTKAAEMNLQRACVTKNTLNITYDRCHIAQLYPDVIRAMKFMLTNNNSTDIAFFIASDNDDWIRGMSESLQPKHIILTSGDIVLSTNLFKGLAPDYHGDHHEAMKKVVLDYLLVSYADEIIYSCGTFSSAILRRSNVSSSSIQRFVA